MKIVYILPYDLVGMPHYTAELANAVSKYADVTVIGSKGINNEYFAKNIKVIRLFDIINFSANNLIKSASLKNIHAFISFRGINIIDQLKPDIIHFTTPLIPPLPVFTCFYGLDRKYPIVYTKHGIFSGSGFKMRVIEETILNSIENIIRFKKIIVHTRTDRDDLLKIKKIPEDDIVVISHGAYSFFKRYKKPGDLQEKNSILFFGNIRDYKGLKYLLMAIPLIEKEISDIKVIIAGEGSLTSYSNYIDKYSEARLEIHNEFVSNEKVAELFQRAEIIVLPYTQMSGQSGILNIACAFNKPIVASDVGGIHMVVEDGKTGYLVPPKNEKLLANAIIKIFKDDVLRNKMNNYMKIKSQELSWEEIAKKHITIYRDILITKNDENPKSSR